MKIVSLKALKKHLTAVTLENGSELLLDSDIVAEKGLIKGAFISDPNALIYESDYKRAKSRALWYLSRADQTEKGLLKKLIVAGFSKKAAENAVARMVELGLINDRNFAEKYCEALSLSGASQREIYFKLIKKDIPKAIVMEVLETEEQSECDKVLNLLKTKYARKLDTKENLQKTVAALARKGFSFSDIKDALKILEQEFDYNED